jgi:hypothetical protein
MVAEAGWSQRGSKRNLTARRREKPAHRVQPGRPGLVLIPVPIQSRRVAARARCLRPGQPGVQRVPRNWLPSTRNSSRRADYRRFVPAALLQLVQRRNPGRGAGHHRCREHPAGISPTDTTRHPCGRGPDRKGNVKSMVPLTSVGVRRHRGAPRFVADQLRPPARCGCILPLCLGLDQRSVSAANIPNPRMQTTSQAIASRPTSSPGADHPDSRTPTPDATEPSPSATSVCGNPPRRSGSPRDSGSRCSVHLRRFGSKGWSGFGSVTCR